MKVVFVSPVPGGTGTSGLAMRARFTLESLSRRHEVQLVSPRSTSIGSRVRRWTHDSLPKFYNACFSIPSDWEEPGSSSCRSASLEMMAHQPELIHVFRFYKAPFVTALLGKVSCQLDLDESEANTRRRLADLARLNGDALRASMWESEAKFFAQAEDKLLPAFERIFVSSDCERGLLLEMHPRLQAEVLPNVVDIPASSRMDRRRGPFTFLFLGGLGYYPNEDGVRYFIRDILPILVARTAGDFRFVVAGGGASTDLKHLMANSPFVESTGYAPNLEALYQAADVALIPLRAGGGTRIKVLEAFAHQVPVVSTRMGVEGLPVTDGAEVLIGDGAEEFAHACVRLMESSELGSDIARSAYELVRTRFSSQVLDATLR